MRGPDLAQLSRRRTLRTQEEAHGGSIAYGATLRSGATRYGAYTVLRVRSDTWCVHMAEAGNRTACDACCRGRDAVPCVMHRRFVRLLQRALEPLVQPRSTLFASTRPLSVRARISRGKVYSDRHASGETEVYEYEHRASFFDGRAAYRIEMNRHKRRRTELECVY